MLTLTDISALEQARARLAQLSAIVESSDDAIIGKTLDGIITSWNDGATRLYGYTAEEAIGRHASFLYPPGRKEEIDDVLQQVRAGRPVERLETTRLRKDGTVGRRVGDVLADPRRGERDRRRLRRSRATSRQLVRARQEIAEREERIRLLLDSTAEAIYGIDLSGVCIFCNAACARLLGYDSPAALIGRQMHPLIHHTRPDGSPYPPEQSPIYEAMRHREGAHVDDEVMWRADGTSFPAEYWSHPILRNNEVIGAVVTFLDVTERRRAEAGNPGRRAAARAVPGDAVARAAESAGGDPERDAGARQCRRGATTACHEAGQVVARQANHMSRLLDDLLDVVAHHARADRPAHRAGRSARHGAVGDRGARARSWPNTTRGSPSTSPTEPMPVIGDTARLQQIQANLLSNASKYSPRGRARPVRTAHARMATR